MKSMFEDIDGCRIDYINMVDTETLEDVETIEKEVMIAAAVYFGKTRLIDNVIVRVAQK